MNRDLRLHAPPRSALVIGMGGLGCPASLALAEGGVRSLTLVDPDRVDRTNLPRQPWYGEDDVGRLKCAVAGERLGACFPGLCVVSVEDRVCAANALDLFAGHDVVLDCTDGRATKLLLSDAALLSGVPLVYAGVVQRQGQAMRIEPCGPCLRCLFDAPPSLDGAPLCAESGILGTVAGIVGAMQARLALEGAGAGTLWIFDGIVGSARVVRVQRSSECRSCGPSSRLSLALSDGPA